MSTHDEPPGTELVRERLRMLAEAADLPVPSLTVDAPRREERPATLREKDGVRTVVVPQSLVKANPPRQLWYLAACLGRDISPEPRRRRRLGAVLIAALVVVYLVLLFTVHVPWLWITVLLLYPVGAWTVRWERAAMEAAGRTVLATAGHPPVEVARAAFADEPDPPFLKALLASESAPSRRIAAAEADARA